HGHLGHDARALERPGETVARQAPRRPRARLDAGEADRAAVGDARPGDRREQRRLAGAVRPDEAVDVTGWKVEGDVVDGDDAAVAHDDLVQLQERGGLAHASASGCTAAVGGPAGRVASLRRNVNTVRTSPVSPPGT